MVIRTEFRSSIFRASELELLACQVEVQPLSADQLVVSPLLDQATAVEDDDQVGIADGA